MARSVPWRHKISTSFRQRQEEALTSTLYILREIGPTGFLLKSDDEAEKIKVFLGDPHTCSCAAFRRDKELCRHILWILLKKFRLPVDNPITFQLGLIEREILEVLSIHKVETPKVLPPSQVLEDGRQCLEQRNISEEDVCPICQECLLLKNQPLTFCRYGCGNSIHLKCMVIWGDHQQSVGEDFISCPLCRECFGPIQVLQKLTKTDQKKIFSGQRDQHLGTICKKCQMSPIVGECYRCCTCLDYYLCQKCALSSFHHQHQFYSRQHCNQRWTIVDRTSLIPLPDGIIQKLMDRDITDDDYDLLLQLDINSSSNNQIPEYKVYSLSVERLRKTNCLLSYQQQCQICLKIYQEGHYVRRLPCNHKFHRSCIDKWLLQRLPTCPLDGKPVYNPEVEKNKHHLVRKNRPVKTNKHLLPAQTCTPILNVSGIQLLPLPQPEKKTKHLFTSNRKTSARNTSTVQRI